MESIKMKRWGYLACGAVIFLFLGVLYAWSLFAGPLEARFGWQRSQTSMVFTMTMLMFGTGNVVGGFLSRRKTIHFYVRVSAPLFFIGFMLASFVTQVWQLYFTYGLFCGFAVGFSYTPMVNAIAQWFPDKPGTVSGVLMLAFALSTPVIGTPIARLFEWIGIENTFRVMGVVFPALLLVLAHFIKIPGADTVFPEPKKRKKDRPSISAEVDMPPKQVVRRPSFYLFILWQIGILTAGFATIGHAATSAASIGASVALATLAASVLSLSNGVGRPIFGYLSDRLGFHRVRILTCLITLFGYGVCLLALNIKSVPLLIVGFMLVGIAYGGTVSNAAAFFRGMYGAKYFGANYGLSFVNNIPTAVIGPPIMAAVYTAAGSYYPAFWTVIALAAIGTLFALVIRKP
ncbi:MAG: MFS transporter [Christensenellales bacterium]